MRVKNNETTSEPSNAFIHIPDSRSGHLTTADTLPQILYSHTEGGSHQHPHDPTKSVCAHCKDLMDPVTHNCPVIAALNRKISQLEADSNAAGKTNTGKNLASPVPFSGPVIDLIDKVFGPKEYCPNNCSQKVYNTTDHQRTGRNDGHSGGFLDYYDCHGVYQDFCPQSGDHVSKPLFITCRKCKGTVSNLRPVSCISGRGNCEPDS